MITDTLDLCDVDLENRVVTDEEMLGVDILEEDIRQKMPVILNILLIDRTTSTKQKNRNIIWGNSNYSKINAELYAPKAQITPDLITGIRGNLIMPRAVKSKEIQKERTRKHAEVFTPTWVVKKQNDEIDKNYLEDDLEAYVKRKWLEVSCGEGPYMASRYDMETGELISLTERVGFVDRKLRRINEYVTDKAEWQRLAIEAYKSSYGFEWSGDSLLIARENLLYTYWDYYLDKWKEKPLLSLLKDIAEIISYNVFQMDGLKYIIPLSEETVVKQENQLDLFQNEMKEVTYTTKPGKKVKIMDWNKKVMIPFVKLVGR